MRRVEADGSFRAVVLHLIDRRGRRRGGAENDLAVRAARAAAARDIRAAGGGEERTRDGESAVDVDHGVLKACRAADGGGAVRDGIADRVHPRCAGEIAPVVVVVDVNLFTAGNRERRIPANKDLNAGQQLDILRDRSRTAYDIDAEVAGDWQDITRRVDAADTGKAGECHGGKADVSVDLDMQPVGAFNIILDDVAA